jgi:hypothetical protein
VALHLFDYLKRTDRFAGTVCFASMGDADEMRRALSMNTDLVAQNPNCVCRVTTAGVAVDACQVQNLN